MVNWPRWLRGPIQVGRGKIPFVREEQQGTQVTSYEYNKNIIRLAHPDNMGSYEKWSLDPEASVALEVLTNIIAGVGYYTEMSEEYQPENDGDKPHKNKVMVDKYSEDINLDEDLQTIVHMMLAKGFCPVEIKDSDDSLYDLNIMPAESFYRYIDKKSNALKYTQERSTNDVIAKWETPDEMAKIILFYFGWSPTRPYGSSLLEPIGNLLDNRDEMNKDMPRAIHRWASPQVIFQSSGPKAEMEKAATEKDPDEALFFGNVTKDEIRVDTIGIDPQARFIPYIELIYYQICEGLHAPLLLYLKNATEASATVMMESVDRLVNGVQRYVKRRVEKYLFAPQTGEPVPRLVWGQPKTGLEETTAHDLAEVINTGLLAHNQVQWLLKQYWSSIPEPDWKADAEIKKIKSPFDLSQRGMQNQPFQRKPQATEIPVETMVERLNDLDTALQIIEANHKARKISLVEACKLADRTITVHMKRAYGEEEWQVQRDEKFQWFLHERLAPKLKGGYTVIPPKDG